MSSGPGDNLTFSFILKDAAKDATKEAKSQLTEFGEEGLTSAAGAFARRITGSETAAGFAENITRSFIDALERDWHKKKADAATEANKHPSQSAGAAGASADSMVVHAGHVTLHDGSGGRGGPHGHNIGIDKSPAKTKDQLASETALPGKRTAEWAAMDAAAPAETAAEASIVEGAAGGAAAIGGGAALAAAVPVIGGIILAGIVLKETFDAVVEVGKRLNEALNQTVDELGNYNAELAAAQAEATYAETVAKINLANKIGPELAPFATARSNLEIAVDELKGEFMRVVAPTLTKLLEMLTGLVDLVRGGLEAVEGVVAFIDEKLGIDVLWTLLKQAAPILKAFELVLGLAHDWLEEQRRKRAAEAEEFTNKLDAFLDPKKLDQFWPGFNKLAKPGVPFKR